MSKNNLKSPYIENKHRVKLYKRGKQWVAMGITLAALTGVSFVTSNTASAAEMVKTDSTSTVDQAAPANNTKTPAAITTADEANTLSGTTAADNTASTTANTDKPSTGTTAAATASPSQPTATNRSADNTGNQDVVSARVSAPTPAPAPAPQAPTQAVGPTVTTTDKSGAASTNPSKTGSSNTTPTDISGQEVAENFVAGGSSGSTKPTINGDTVDLTDPTNSAYVQNGAVVAKDAVDFNTDFSLNATVNVKWDTTMGGWLGGDGMAVAFQPISTNDALTKGSNGSSMGLVTTADGTISYIISTDAIGQSPSTVDGVAFPHGKNWVIYQSGANSKQATGGVYDTGIAVPQGSVNGSLSFTFDVIYKVATKQLVTNIVDSNNQIVKTYSRTIDDNQIGKNFVLGVTAATMSSKAAYSVTINKYTYVPADAKLNITSNMPNVAQSNINGTPGQVIAFYQEGTAKPTVDNKGNAVSVAYTVPKVDGYTLLSPQFVTLTAGGVNTVAINYVGKQITNATVTIPTNKGEQTVTNVSGQVGSTVQISVPAIPGYTPDKTKVTATVNADGKIIVNGPKAQSGDAGYVTYTGDTQTLTVKIGNTGKVWTTTGASDTPINYDQQAIVALIPKGYTINSNTSKKIFDSLLQQLNAPTAFDHDSAKDQSVTLPLQAAEEFSHTTTTRTIHFVDNTGKTVSPDVVQTVNWVRVSNATTDPTTGAFQPMDWYASVTVPTIAGYTPDITTIAEVYPMMVTMPKNAEDITVTYTADTQTMVVHVGDKTWTTTGPSGSAINYDASALFNLIPKDYTVTYDQAATTIEALLKEAPANFDLDSAKDQTWTLPISPAENFNHTTTTRTIHFVDNTGKTVSPDVVQTVNWVQTVDATTSKPTDAYRPMDWYTSVTAPIVTGYAPDSTTIAANYPMITDTPKNAEDVTVTYTGETQTMVVHVGDKNWTTTGPSDGAINYDTAAIIKLIPDGYTIGGGAAGTTIEQVLSAAPKQFDTDSTKDQSWTLPLAEKLDIQSMQTTRTIHFVDGNGKTLAPDVVQTITWTRPVSAATGKPTDVYTPMAWYTSVSAPTVTGYTPNTATVAADSPLMTADPENAKDVTVTYTGDTQKLIVTVGNKTWTTTGESGSDINYDTKAILALIPDGYSISANTSGSTLADWLANAPKRFDTDTAKDQTLTLPISPAESFNHTTTTRTIHFVDGNGNTLAPDVVQTVNWVQTVDAVTGKATDVYTPMDWYTEISTPTVAGYTTTATKVAADYPMITDAPTNAKDITIVYTGNQITADVTIPSNQGSQTVAHVTGNVGDTVSVPVPTLDGYTADKTMVSATVNPDGTITVNGPKAKPGDAGYVTYTANNTGVPDQGGNNGLPDNDQTDVDTPTTNDTPQPDTIPNTVSTPTSDANKETNARQNSTAVKSNQNDTRSGGSTTVTATQNGTVAGIPATAGQTTVTHLPDSVTATGQTATGQQTDQSAAGQLPQTSERSDQVKTTGVLGLILLSLLSLFGLRRKETNDK